jgi:hypothetical protein
MIIHHFISEAGSWLQVCHFDGWNNKIETWTTERAEPIYWIDEMAQQEEIEKKT